jgi:hypothetical protein
MRKRTVTASNKNAANIAKLPNSARQMLRPLSPGRQADRRCEWWRRRVVW